LIKKKKIIRDNDFDKLKKWFVPSGLHIKLGTNIGHVEKVAIIEKHKQKLFKFRIKLFRLTNMMENAQLYQ